MLCRRLLFLFLVSIYFSGYAQPLNFTVANHFFTGVKILKVKRDFNDPYLWVLAQNNQVFRINSIAQTVDDYTGTFSSYNNLQFIDIARAQPGYRFYRYKVLQYDPV
jgi:hypothetical protein